MLQQQSNAATDLQQALGPQPRNPLDRTSEPFLHLILLNGFAREATVPSDKTRSPAHTASIVRLVKQGLPLADLFLFRPSSIMRLVGSEPFLIRHHIGHQSLVARSILARNHNCLRD